MTSSLPSSSSRSVADRLLLVTVAVCSALAGSIVLVVVAFIVWNALPALNRVGPTRFFTDAGWYPGSGEFNLLPMVVATAVTTAGAMVLAMAAGIASGVFSCFYAPPAIARWYRRIIEVLAGIPSVVYGLWGLLVLVPMVSKLGGSGQCLLSAIVILALMILPTVALTSHAAFRAVPAEYIQGAAALGLGRWATVRRVAIPAARSGILTGLVLATGRGIGETMAVLMVAGNVVAMPGGLLDPVRTLTANIALEMSYATSEHRSALFVGGLVLMLIAIGLVLLVELRRQR